MKQLITAAIVTVNSKTNNEKQNKNQNQWESFD